MTLNHKILPFTLALLWASVTAPGEPAGGGIPDNPADIRPLKTGTAVPAAVLRDHRGESAALSDILTGKATLIVFYRGGWCPYCNRQLQGLMDIESDLLDLGVQIIGISPDSPAKLKTAADPPLAYRLFSDASMETTRAFGLAYRVSDSTYRKLRKAGIDIEEAAGRDHRLLPVPGVFLVDFSGRIVFRSFNPDYTSRPDPQALLLAARRLFPEAPPGHRPSSPEK